jgi:hypothetical protein
MSRVAVLRRPSGSVASLTALAALAAYLLFHLERDLRSKPLYFDEALAGLIAARPFGETVATAVWDRGGAPLHFVLAHVALALDPSPAALRWLSVVFALATVAVCFDLGRRLAGPVAGVVAAGVAATSTLLGIYGSFGRMYALFAFAGALAADLFVRAIELRTATAAAAAAGAAWLLPATHPYGVLPVAVGVAVALVLWWGRGRPRRPALPTAAVVASMAVFLVGDIRLAERFSVGVHGDSLAGPADSWSQLASALSGFAGGEGALFAFFLVAATAGFATVARTNAPFAAYAALAIVLPPLLFMLFSSGAETGFSRLAPRHLVFLLPIWVALIGVATARAVRGRHPAVQALAAASVVAAALAAPVSPSIRDARVLSERIAEPGRPGALAAPAEWLRQSIAPGDVLVDYRPVFLAALPESAQASVLAFGPGHLLRRSLARVDLPAPGIVVALALLGERVDEARLKSSLGPGSSSARFPRWLLLRLQGPFADDAAVLRGAQEALLAARESVAPEHGEVARQVERLERALCLELRTRGRPCL